MPYYTYECPEHDCFDVQFPFGEAPETVKCSVEEEYATGNDKELLPCGLDAKRIFSGVNMAQVMQSHYNESTGTVVSSKRQHSDDLKRRSEEATLRTGIEHNFVPMDGPEIKEQYGSSD